MSLIVAACCYRNSFDGTPFALTGFLSSTLPKRPLTRDEAPTPPAAVFLHARPVLERPVGMYRVRYLPGLISTETGESPPWRINARISVPVGLLAAIDGVLQESTMAQRGGGGTPHPPLHGQPCGRFGHAPYRYHRTAVRAVNGARTRRIRGITCAVACPLRLRKGKRRFRGQPSKRRYPILRLPARRGHICSQHAARPCDREVHADL